MIKRSQPVKQSAKSAAAKSAEKRVNKNIKQKNTSKSSSKKYGISKLEAYFAHTFLDKLGLKYIYEYEAKDIGRFYDFAVVMYPELEYDMSIKNNINSIVQDNFNGKILFIVEVDGDYFHSNPLKVNEKKLNPMQKHNKYVDFLKDRWCDLHCIPLIRIWENDIRNNPQKVFDEINKYVGIGNKKKRIDELKKKPH